MYLELIAPDPSQPAPPRPRWFDLDALGEPRLITWAVKSTDLDAQEASAWEAGLRLGNIRAGRRESAGRTLSWRLTYPDLRLGDGLIPFFIDWGDGAHPADDAPGGLRLHDLRAEHPDAAGVSAQLRQLGIWLPVARGAVPALIATLETPRGRIQLR